ncbi:unnamed protein product [Diatraea saccharalis]|uniref:EB domain-containing protein n=1 Tax=Diatraea saccharalis TaxID=40085 RepID=A0A9N9WH53_9NEOP|nr:unnamed protein product [Diatraea saccharalis]
MHVLRDPFSMICHDGSCDCAPEYYLRQRGECRKKALAVGDACVIDEDCQFEGGACQMSTFTCVSESSANEDVTEIKSELAASPTTSIEENSEVAASLTLSVETRQHGLVCSNNNDCVAPFQCSSLGVCICPLGYYPNDAGTVCLAEMGSPVTSPDQCVGMFTEVRDGICNCQVNFYFDEAMRGCVKPAIRLEDFCFNDATCHTFGVFARCVYTGPWGLHSCECTPGETVWNEQRRICALFSGIGESCEVDSDCIAGDIEIQCVKNDEGVGVCSCPEGLVAMDGLCLQMNQDLGDTCQVDIECSNVDNAVCSNGICSCGGGYQQIGDSCAPEIGGTCVETADCAIENTICVKSTNTCQCSPEFVASAASCWPAVSGYGSTCNVTEQCAASLGEAGVCVNSECACLEQYHFRDGQCWVKTGIFEACSRSSVCFLEDGSHRLECRNSLCQCTFDYPYIPGQGTCSECITILTLYINRLLRRTHRRSRSRSYSLRFIGFTHESVDIVLELIIF